jgi:hypothetical protein
VDVAASARLSTRAVRAFEVAAPGFAIGLACGGLIGLLGALGGMSAGNALLAVILLGCPLGAFGALYDGLLATGRMGIGTFAPAVAFWLPLFPLARVLHETLSDLAAGQEVALPGGAGGFVAYQVLLSLGYGIGFVFLHEQVAPRWYLRVRGHNPTARRIVERYTAYAAAMVARDRRRGGRPRGRRPAG